MIKRSPLWLFAVGMLACSCTVPSSNDVPSEKLGTVSQAVNPTTYEASADDGNPNVNDGTQKGKDITTTFGVPGGGAPTASLGFCYLMKVEGLMASPWAELDLYAGSDGYWHVKALKHVTIDDHGGPKGKWGCHKFSDFTGFPSATTAAATRYDVTLQYGDGLGDEEEVDISGADKWCPLTGGRGDFDNAIQPTVLQFFESTWKPASSKTTLKVRQQLGGQPAWAPNNYQRASTWCIHFPSQGFTWTRGTQTTWQTSTSGDTLTLDLMSSSTCYLENAGNSLFAGNGTRIVGSPTRWALVIDGGTQGQAACIPYAQ